MQWRKPHLSPFSKNCCLCATGTIREAVSAEFGGFSSEIYANPEPAESTGTVSRQKSHAREIDFHKRNQSGLAGPVLP
jgi:hypothetical protein